MNLDYTATIFYEEEILAYKQGDNVEELYLWMLTHAHGHPGSIRGEIMELKSSTVIRKFRKSSTE
ncbi:MAG: hypothetical protein H0U75_13370 [Legionella sp.]|nr:hypothetical protein [Legionella sp.]